MCFQPEDYRALTYEGLRRYVMFPHPDDLVWPHTEALQQNSVYPHPEDFLVLPIGRLSCCGSPLRAGLCLSGMVHEVSEGLN